MKRPLLVLLAVAALAFPAQAAAKGPDHATISGPGLNSELAIAGTEGSGDLGLLVEEAGFFATVWQQSPDPTLVKQPVANLGPRYTIVYRVPGPDNQVDTLRADLYPYARGGPVSYMPADQVFWTDQRTRGGWYRGTGQLKSMLVKAGLPAHSPVAEKRSSSKKWTSRPAAFAAAVGVALGAVALGFAMHRRKS